MLSSEDLESLIASKKREIEEEKVQLGLVPRLNHSTQENNENGTDGKKQVIFKESEHNGARILEDHNATRNQEEKSALYEREEVIPADLERYIRRCLGLPVMLKAGEFSPNNPLVRGERVSGICGDAMFGLGEYERRRNTLRKIRQAQYREYLDRQAKKKQEAKEDAEKERREQEQKEREREERERQLLLERERYSPERRRASVSCVPLQQYDSTSVSNNKVDSSVQMDGVTKPLSVAVQTDDAELYRLSPSPKLTEAERELSPRTVGEPRNASWNKWEASERRRSYGDFDERSSSIKKNRDRLHSDLRHSYMPSIFDADAIQLRNIQTQKDAAERRQFYQQELKNQIMEQQRIREERKSREKLLEQAEMRRLEEQLRMLRGAQEKEILRHKDIAAAVNENGREYESKRIELQRDIDNETQKLRVSSHPTRNLPKRPTDTSKSDSQKLPFYYPNEKTFQPIEKKPYSFNIPDNSIFSANYDVDSYLRKNLNFKNKNGVEIFNNNDRNETQTKEPINNERNTDRVETKESRSETKNAKTEVNDTRRFVIEKALIHEPKEKPSTVVYDIDSLSIPVLRHSPKRQAEPNDNTSQLSEAMKKVDDKWKVPVVQKNILKSLPNEDGKNISILTQLGSIRRQLQLEQLKLDKMLKKSDC